jgi:transposase-like protein
MSKTTNKFFPEVHERAGWMVMDHEGELASRWAAVASIAAKIGCSAHTLLDWVKKADVVHQRGPLKLFEAVEFATLEWVD